MNSPIIVKKVNTPKERKQFLTFPWRIYKNDPLWVPPLMPDWQERIDPACGVFFKRGTADFFMAWQAGQPVGTVCAAEDREMNAERGVKECIFGFFNFIQDYAVMEALLAQVKEWAFEHGLDVLTGPFNLDYEDSYGILVDGRDRPPALLCGHTPAYYLDFVRRYGFQPIRGENLAFALDITENTPALQDLARMAERVRRHNRFKIRGGDMSHWEAELDRIYVLLNVAMRHLPDYRSWPRDVVFSSLGPFRTIANPDLILFAEEGGETIGWFPGLPNLNEVFIHADGLRHPWDALKVWWLMRRRTDCLTVKSVLVRPEYWGTGVAILLFDEMVQRARALGYRWVDLSLTSDDNPRTPQLAARFGAKVYKRYQVYRLPLNNPG